MTLFDEIMKDPSKISVAALMLAACFAFYKGYIIPKYAYDAALVSRDLQIAKLEKEVAERVGTLTKERDEFKTMAFRIIEITERTQKVQEEKKT